MKNKYVTPAPRKLLLFFLILFLFHFRLNAEPAEKNNVSPFLVFHDLGRNILSSVTYNFGLNFLGAGFGTWVFIESGIDWEWRNIAYNNAWLANAGLPMLFMGYIVPILTPIPLYLAGFFTSNVKLQVTAVALLQALAITQLFHVPAKMITGRSTPGVISGVFFEPNNHRDPRVKDFSGEFSWFKLDFYDGWPSGHTACAFSAAAVISDIYSDRPWIKFGAYTYAVLMGISVSVNTHWLSDSLAGALYGFAVGKVVARSFNRMLGKDTERDKIRFYAAPDRIGILYQY